eukprot:358504-Chlamydomonas_euryale.AAC.5
MESGCAGRQGLEAKWPPATDKTLELVRTLLLGGHQGEAARLAVFPFSHFPPPCSPLSSHLPQPLTTVLPHPSIAAALRSPPTPPTTHPTQPASTIPHTTAPAGRTRHPPRCGGVAALLLVAAQPLAGPASWRRRAHAGGAQREGRTGAVWGEVFVGGKVA